ncbi:MAG: hypothetical protein COB77_06520 [Gammaproteobacteria bacterium]|nr:MAG: hypothetical protein COB77_06520 [Gammaproteobacteria bacterium]
MFSMNRLILLIVGCSIYSVSALADIVKPALVEITVTQERRIQVEVRASIEALLTGINARYKNTKDAPNAEKYDDFRQMSSQQLLRAFSHFKHTFLNSISLKTTDDVVLLTMDVVEIPPTGYTKVPRISVIKLSGYLPASADQLQWYYPAIFGDNAVRVKQVDEDERRWYWSQWQWLRNDEASKSFSLTEIVARQSTVETMGAYSLFGFKHIVPNGLDHILFILGLFLLSSHWRALLWQVTMFTVAHTITLGLAMNNIVQLPAAVVEPLIALSIAYVGIENLYVKKLRQRRLILVFIFGLLHGLGFAEVLSGFGLPDDDFVIALISFNVGVEFGQLFVLLMAYALFRFGFKTQQHYRRCIVIPGSVVISFIGGYWFLERLQLF